MPHRLGDPGSTRGADVGAGPRDGRRAQEARRRSPRSTPAPCGRKHQVDARCWRTIVRRVSRSTSCASTHGNRARQPGKGPSQAAGQGLSPRLPDRWSVAGGWRRFRGCCRGQEAARADAPVHWKPRSRQFRRHDRDGQQPDRHALEVEGSTPQCAAQLARVRPGDLEALERAPDLAVGAARRGGRPCG